MHDTSLFKISIAVIIFHFTLILFSFFSFTPMNFSKSPNRLIVKTVSLKKEEPKPKIMLAPKKEPVKPVVQKEQKVEKNKNLILALERVKKLNFNSTSNNNINSKLKDLPMIESLKIDTSDKLSESEKIYFAILGDFLRKTLRLPSIGAVKIHLTHTREGSFISMEIISHESERNKAYVEKMIPGQKFPPFGKELKEEKHTFKITLVNGA